MSQIGMLLIQVNLSCSDTDTNTCLNILTDTNTDPCLKNLTNTDTDTAYLCRQHYQPPEQHLNIR